MSQPAIKTVEKAFKTEMAPHRDQADIMRKWCKARLYAFNWMLEAYNAEYTRVTGIIENALKCLAFPEKCDSTGAMDCVLKYSFIGFSKSSKSKKKAATTKRRRRTNEKIEADRAAFKAKMKDSDFTAARKVVIEALVVKWRAYCEAIQVYRDLPDDEREDADFSKKPKYRPRLFNLPVGESPFYYAKKKFRAATHVGEDRENLDVTPSTVIDSACTDVRSAFSNWLSYISKPKSARVGIPRVGRPRFKDEGSVRSCRLCPSGGIEIGERTIKLSKVGVIQLKERGYMPVGRTKHSVTIREEASKWFASVPDEGQAEQYSDGRGKVGIDVGIRKYAVLHDDSGQTTIVANPRRTDNYLKRLKMLQRNAARKVGALLEEVTMPDGSTKLFPPRHIEVRRAKAEHRKVKTVKNPEKQRSKRWKKSQGKIARCHYRARCRRHSFQQNLSTQIIRQYGQVSVENMNVRELLHKAGKKVGSKSLRRDINDAGWYEFTRQLAYKGEWHGTHVERIDRSYPSTKMCSNCGADMKVNTRTRVNTCPACGLVIDRDENAAKNLLAEMLRREAERDAG